MNRILSIAAVLVLLACAAAQTSNGIKPRASVRDYPASAHTADLIIGAAPMSPKQVAHSFATDLNRGYIVVEIGVYPAVGKTPTLDPQDFVLRPRGMKEVLRPASPQVIAASLQRPEKSGHDITLYPTVGVVYGTGGGVSGTATSVGVGVGIGGSAPAASTPADRKVMETELTEKALPGGTLHKAVAGYLYFPASTNKKAVYRLEYASNGAVVSIDLTSTEQ